MKTKFVLIILLCGLSIRFLLAETIIDTLYSIPELDGGISYTWNNNTYWSNTSASNFVCGDWAFLAFGWDRGYLSFSLPVIPIGFDLIKAEILVYQYYSSGNGVYGVFPIWDVNPPPDTLGCILDHIDYGNSLDTSDWTAGDPGDIQTINSNIGIISNTATYEFKNLEVTTSVIEDYDAERDKTQYRLRFLENNDWDQYDDMLEFSTSNSMLTYRPYIIFTWWDGQNSIEENEISIKLERLVTFPNPFNGEITIEYSLSNTDNNLEIYNIKGQKVFSQINLHQAGSIIWKCDAETSGIYLVKISNSEHKYVKKIMYLK